MTTASVYWKDTRSALKEYLDATSYNSWIENLTFVKYNKLTQTLYLQVENAFKQGMIEEKYLPIIVTVASEKFGAQLTIKLILSGDDIDDSSHYKRSIMDDSLDQEIMFNPRFTFENFVTGPNSAFAANAAIAVAENPGKKYSPLFIYGDSGLGKTHLMNAIGIYIMEHFPKKKVLFVSSETFTADYVNASREKNYKEFKKKYRNVDVLLIDDIQFISEKERTVEEVYNTYNTLYSVGKQMVFSSDRPPNDLLGLDERLVSRLSSGLTVDIKPPSYEIKVAILKNKIILDNIADPERFDEIISFIAETIKTNVRELEGALNRVLAFGAFTGEEYTKGLAKKALKGLVKDMDSSGPTATDIKKVVASSFGISVADIDSSKRSRSVAIPRQVAMYLCREMTTLSFPKIAKEFGKDYSTVHHAYEKMAKDKEEDINLGKKIDDIIKTLENNY